MALEIRQNLSLAQKLVITPQLQQAIKLLQLSRFELENLVRQELTENPALEESVETTPEEAELKEEGEDPSQLHKPEEDKVSEVGTKEGELKEPTDFDWENYLETYNSHEYGAPNIREYSDEFPSYENIIPNRIGLDEHLLWQLHLSNFPPQEIEIAEEIIGNIDDDGYFRGDIAEIARNNQVSENLALDALKKIQDFDPPGVAARDLKECLKIQTRPYHDSAPFLCEIIDTCLNDLERYDYHKIAKKTGLSPGKVEELAHIIHMMEPKPGRPFGGENPQYIIPDVYVHKIGDDYVVVLNDDGMPKLQISRLYKKSIQGGNGPENKEKEYIQGKLKSALWLIRSIHQRQRTLYRVTRSIVNFQREFLEKGISRMKPMVLKDVADDIGMHESTVSRVTTNKYVQTPRGLFELKFFFNTGVSSTSENGVTSEAVKGKIRELVSKEDQTSPLSDQAIADGIQRDIEASIARRTVAKYRESMGILPSSRRRRPVFNSGVGSRIKLDVTS